MRSMALCYLALLAAERISSLLRRMGEIVLARMLNIMLAALTVQFVIDGVTTIGK
jgi:multiple antibiotic resistance protein